MEIEGEEKLVEKIRRLIILQSYDLKIRDAKARLDKWPMLVKELDKALQEAQKEVDMAMKELNALRSQRKELEAEITQVESKIKKKYIQLYEVKSNKDYQQMLNEIDELKKEKSALEDQVIELMEQGEQAELVVKEKKKGKEEREKQVAEEKARLEKEMESLRVSLYRLEEDRKRFVHEIDHRLLKDYDRLMKVKGTALSPVIKGVCQLCHVTIPPQKFNELLKCNSLMNCPNCERIIYWGENELFANLT